MDNKKSYTIHAILSLVVGALIYFLFRPHTLFLSWLVINAPLAHLSFPTDMVVRYYLPDALWSYALCFSLYRLHLPSVRKAIFFSLGAIAFGCLWEGLQYFDYVPGTGDCLDCVAYGVGSVMALCIYFFIKRRRI